jgi:hypothetical protein
MKSATETLHTLYDHLKALPPVPPRARSHLSHSSLMEDHVCQSFSDISLSRQMSVSRITRKHPSTGCRDGGASAYRTVLSFLRHHGFTRDVPRRLRRLLLLLLRSFLIDRHRRICVFHKYVRADLCTTVRTSRRGFSGVV